MNLKKLKQAEAQFMAQYPKGFDDPGMEHIKKRHKLEPICEYAQANLTRTQMNKPEHVAEVLTKIVSRSSMVSMFEKPRFRDFIGSLNSHEKEMLAFAFEKRLYGRAKRAGFEEILDLLSHHKFAKWSIISVVPFYFAPTKEAFVKPTTAKGIVAFLEVEDMVYKPRPSWEFYSGYLKLLKQVKKEVDPALSPNFAALSGFLMSTMNSKL